MPEDQAGDAFAQAAGEAVKTYVMARKASVMAFRMVLAFAEAVRRQQQERAEKEEARADVDEAMAEASEAVKKLLPEDISAALLEDAEWPEIAQQLMALKRAGVDLETMLPRVGEIAVTVRDQVAANAERVAGEGTDEWVKALRETLPAGSVREAILTSPAWPEMASTMTQLAEWGVNVREVLAAAYNEMLAVGQAVAKGLGAAAEPAMSRDAQLSYGPLTTGLDLPRDLNLSDRERAFKQLAISPGKENERYIRWVREAIPGHEREADLLVASRKWPLVAARMAQMEKDGMPVREHLARLAKDTSWQQGPAAQLGTRLVQAVGDALGRPAGDAAAESRVRVNTTAARATSTSMDPTKAQAAKGTAPAEAGVAAHRQSGPAQKSGKTK
ncbi:hypothetical protein C1J00_21375 [Streptomyces cahuitamycinicus]|uniref:Uncharacterized protein n=2 Tax=Streptomyces cahuitamycinicus TaxID=2070367 RepID=A0A2N8TMM2_9ACTN|nr:hypothetical protein C1J00_21375 [Streptomyces cahuitamycinicus]